jgi:hypothetical protein
MSSMDGRRQVVLAEEGRPFTAATPGAEMMMDVDAMRAAAASLPPA